VELGVSWHRAVAPNPALEVGSTQRRGVGRRHADVLAGAPKGRVGEGDRRPEWVEIDDIVGVFVHVGVDIAVVDLPGEPVPVEVRAGEFDRRRVNVAAGRRVARLGGPDRPHAACGHRVEIRLAVVDGPEDGDRNISVQLLDGVIKDAAAGALARAVSLLGHLDRDAALRDLHTTSSKAGGEKGRVLCWFGPEPSDRDIDNVVIIVIGTDQEHPVDVCCSLL